MVTAIVVALAFVAKDAAASPGNRLFFHSAIDVVVLVILVVTSRRRRATLLSSIGPAQQNIVAFMRFGNFVQGPIVVRVRAGAADVATGAATADADASVAIQNSSRSVRRRHICHDA